MSLHPRRLLCLIIATLTLALSPPALGAGENTRGVEVGLRFGYSVPLMHADSGSGRIGPPPDYLEAGATHMRDLYSGSVPVFLDAGVRVIPRLYVGAFLQYGFVALNTDSTRVFAACSRVVDVTDCSAHDILIGGMIAFHFLPDKLIDPWVGIGSAYESTSGSPQFSYSGPQFFNIQAGANYKVMPDFDVGPFLYLGLGEYTSISNSQIDYVQAPSPSLNGWLTLGVRGAYNINNLW